MSYYVSNNSNNNGQQQQQQQQQQLEQHHHAIYHISFSQQNDEQCVCIAFNEGFMVFSFSKMKLCSHKYEQGGMSLASLHDSTALLSIVGAGTDSHSPKTKLFLYSAVQLHTICQFNFPKDILGIYSGHSRLIVALETVLYLFDAETAKLIQKFPTASNRTGLAALCKQGNLLAFPSIESVEGDVCICNVFNGDKIKILNSSDSPLAAMSFNVSGNRLATASSKGMLIHVFSIPDGQLLYSLRRGSVPAVIYSLCFSNSSTNLVVSSDKATIHIFKLTDPSMKSFFGTRGMERKGTQRNFAHITLHREELRNVCIFSNDDSKLIVVTYEGILYEYAFSESQSGKCKLLNEHNLMSHRSFKS